MGGFAPWCLEALEARLHRAVRPAQAGERPWLRLVRDETLPAEGYRFRAEKDGVTVSAAAELGVVWALTTLAELAEAPEGLAPCEIEDAPRYGHRGLSLDCSRHFFPAEEVKKIIEQLARVKMNVLHWHLVDDQGWRIESHRFPLLHETSGAYYTQEQIREIVEFARVRGVEIIPEIDLPGHTTALLAAYPQYSCAGKPVELRQHGGIFDVILCAGKDETFAFLEELLGEICPLFPSPRFHIGGDEAPKTEWKKCPHCKARMESLGLTDYEDLQGWFTNRVTDILKKYGKRAICWNDTLEAKDPDTGNQVQFWTTQHEKPVPAFILMRFRRYARFTATGRSLCGTTMQITRGSSVSRPACGASRSPRRSIWKRCCSRACMRPRKLPGARQARMQILKRAWPSRQLRLRHRASTARRKLAGTRVAAHGGRPAQSSSPG